MSVLVLPDPAALSRAVVVRLLSQGDEVRVLVPPEKDLAWRELGVHVAIGDATDADLVERAAQNCRSVVLLGHYASDGEVLAAVAEGAAAAGVDRLIVCRGRDRSEVSGVDERWRSGYVVIEQTSGRWPRVKSAPDELVAEAVDAADDLAGEPRLKVDLNDEEGLALLGL